MYTKALRALMVKKMADPTGPGPKGIAGDACRGCDGTLVDQRVHGAVGETHRRPSQASLNHAAGGNVDVDITHSRVATALSEDPRGTDALGHDLAGQVDGDCAAKC